MQLSNHDNSRIASRSSLKMVDSMNMLLLLLPGTSTTYYGDELGMSDIDISGRQSVDPLGLIDKVSRALRYIYVYVYNGNVLAD